MKYNSNDTQFNYPLDKCIHQLFEKQCLSTPDAVAAVFVDGHNPASRSCSVSDKRRINQQLTYSELNCRANQLAHYLKTLGVKPDVLVGICVERSLEMIVGLLGILKAGGAYVPLDSEYPQDRLSFMLEDAQVRVLLTQQQLVESVPKHQARVVCLDTDWEKIAQNSQSNLENIATPDNLAYVIYTSGSTGKPKGVLVNHKNVVSLFAATNSWYHFNQDDVWTLFHSYAFDFSVWEIWGALLYGGRLVVVSYLVTRSPESFYQLLCQEKVTVLNQTPSAFRQLIQAEQSTATIGELNLRLVIFGGEALEPRSLQPWFQRHGDQSPQLVNMYGITETTVHVTYHPLSKADLHGTASVIGRPIPELQIYILDESKKPVPIGVPGEMYVGGEGVTCGYLNRPELTQQRFIPHPFSKNPQARLYKTGDQARYLPDGNIEYLGRIDNQVKIRGFRIELGEIEALLNQHPDVLQAIVVAREDIPSAQRLVAYIVLNQKPQAMPGLGFAYATSLKRFLEEKLPNYMVPAAFVILESFPLTPNGKVDRRNLPAPDRARPDLEEAFVTPSNPLEEKLALIWAELLGLEQIGANDNFFYLGGHSLIATQMLSRLREVFQVELFFYQIFENPTIKNLAQLIEQSHKQQRCELPIIERIPRKGLLPVSFAQERVYFIQQLAPESKAYQFQATLRFYGQLNVAILQQCLNEIVLRHEIFRTTYPAVNGQLFQVIHPHQSISFTVIDLLSFPEAEREAEAQKLVEKEVQKHLDINQLPLVRWVLLNLSDQEHLLVHIEHHMVHDGWSFNVFLAELIELYQAFSLGHPSPLAEPLLQFADFAHWQRQWITSQEAQAQLAYWQQQLSGSSPLLQLPLDRPRPTEQTYRGDLIRIELPIELCESLRVLSRREGVTLFMTMLAAFLVMLHQYTGQDDISVGTAVANRRMHEIEKLIGMIVNNLVLRTNLSNNPTFRELLGRVRQVTLEAYANEDLPFDQVVEVLNPIRNLSHNPLFQVMFSFHDSPMPNLSLPGLDICLHELISNKSVKFDLDFLVIPRFEQRVQNSSKTKAKGITLILEYNSDLFDAATIRRMLEQYQNLLNKIVANPNQHLGELPLLSEAEQQLLVKWNENCREFTENKCIHELFAEQVERSPNVVAVEQSGQKLTHRELSDRTNQLAHYLQTLGVKPETLVGICVERSLEMIVGLLGILKAGGAYIPLDPAYPKERLVDILEDTQLGILLTQERLLPRLPDQTRKTICLDTDWTDIARHSTANPKTDVQLHNLAYIIYTSGSTGKPKGVMIEHKALLNFTITAAHEYAIKARDVILQFASICFDTSVEEIFPSLLIGAKLVLRNEQMLYSSEEFWQCCREWQLTVLDLPTAYWHQLVAELKPQDSRISPSLRLVIVGGEEVQQEKVKHWHSSVAHFPHPPQLFNSYGPTEATVVTTLQRLNSTAATDLSIGRPISNTQVYIFDQYLQPVPIGVPGELHVGGAGLARGYWQRPELTDLKFIQSPISSATCDRLYKTGDLAKFRADGTLQYLGRIDGQVKIRGFRIELGEIETALRQHQKVFQSVVIAREDFPGQKRLVAYLVPHQPQPTTDELRRFLKQKLPNYMVPSAFVLLEALPMTPNQKVDYRALSAYDLSYSIEENFVAPRTYIEEKLAAIWSEILRLEQVGIHDNYFELGGDSIVSIQVISRANQAGIQLITKQLFQYQTVAELAAVAGITRQVAAQQGLVTGFVELTPIQQWFFEQKLPEPHYFNQSVLLEVPPDLKPELLQQVVQQLLAHHDALRLQFVEEGENWQQINTSAPKTTPLTAIDLSHLSPEAQQTAMSVTDAELQASLNLSSETIVRVALFQLGKNQPGRLLFIIHHLAVDGISWRILLEDLATAYQQISLGEAIKLPPKTTSCQYWSNTLTEYAQSDAISRELDYWLSQCNLKATTLPVDYLSTTQENTIASTASVRLSLSEEQTRALLQDVPSAYNTQINDVLLTALVQSFAQWTGEPSLLVDLEGHGREDLFEDVDLSRTVGWFTTLFPVQLQLEKVDHLGEALKLVKEQLRCIPNRGIGYGILRYLNKNPETQKKLQMLPQAQVSFNYLGQFDQVLSASAVLGLAKEFKAEQSLLNKRSHLLGISGFIRAQKLEMTWAYSEKVHKRPTIEFLAVGFMEALKTLIAHCQLKESQGYTPSDFSAAKLNQKQLDKFLSKINIRGSREQGAGSRE